MRKIYFLFASGLTVIILLLVFSFLFFEKEKHKSFIYTVRIGEKNAGYVKTDRYRTEDKIIYKSTAFQPKELKYKIIHEKTIFSKKEFRLEKFVKEHENRGPITEAAYIKDNGKAFDFLGRTGSKWGSVTGIAHARNISVFDVASMTAYMPIIDKYDFARGGAQSFNVLYLAQPPLPPARGRIVFRSIRDEYINVEGKKTKTEVLVIRSKILPDVYLWVSKKDKTIAQLEIKENSLFMKRSAFTKKFDITYFAPEGSSYDSLEVLFPSDDIALAGTVSMPKKEGKLPAVLLVAEEGPYTRENAGLYTDMNNILARKGFIVLRFDRRGIGNSQGDNSSISLTDDIKDIGNALKFLSNYEKVDTDRIFIIAHGEACSYLPQLDFSGRPVKGAVMLAPSEPAVPANLESVYILDSINAMSEVDEKYAETLGRLKRQTIALVKGVKKEYVFAQGKHLFAKRMSQLMEFKSFEGFKKMEIPSLIVYGKKDKQGSPKYINNIEALLAEGEPRWYQIVYFRNLGHFLGKLVDDKDNMVQHYRINAEAMETITDWIDERAKAADLTNI